MPYLQALYKGILHPILVDEDIASKFSDRKIYLSVRGYAVTNVGYGRKGRKPVPLHKLIMGNSEGLVVDHINRNKLDNRRDNLRLITRQQNTWNLTKEKPRGPKPSKYIGVYWHAVGKGSWRARITHNGITYRLGLFQNEDDAARAVNNAIVKLRGKEYNLNMIQGGK